MKVSKQKTVIIALFILSLFGVLIGQSIAHPEWAGFCSIEDHPCIFSFPVFELGQPLFFGASYLAFTFLILLFVRLEAFKAWIKFAVWFIPLAFILITITPVYSDFSPGRLQLTKMLGTLYIVLSLIIIAYKYIRLHIQKKETAASIDQPT